MLKYQKGISLVALVFIILSILIVGSVVIFFVINKSDNNNETENTVGESDTPINNNASNTNNNINNNNTTNNQSSTNTKKLKTAKVPGKEIYVDYDSSLRKKDEVYTSLMYSNNDSLVGLAYKYDVDYTGTLDGVVELFKSDFINDASLSSRGDLFGEIMVIDESKEVTIAGRDSMWFKGTVSSGEEWKCHVYGYAFIIDGVPCAVIGLVSAQEQDADMIAEINAQVDEIASTIRTEK